MHNGRGQQVARALHLVTGCSCACVDLPDACHALQLLVPDGGIELCGGEHEGMGLAEALLFTHRMPGGFVALRSLLLVAGIGQPEAKGIESLPGAGISSAVGKADLKVCARLCL